MTLTCLFYFSLSVNNPAHVAAFKWVCNESPGCLLCLAIIITLQGFYCWRLHHCASQLPLCLLPVISLSLSLLFAVVHSFRLLSSPEVLITQADAAKLRHCPAVIRWRSNKASHSIKLILIWCKSNMLSLPAVVADTQLHRRREPLDPKSLFTSSSWQPLESILMVCCTHNSRHWGIIGIVMYSFSRDLFTWIRLNWSQEWAQDHTPFLIR